MPRRHGTPSPQHIIVDGLHLTLAHGENRNGKPAHTNKRQVPTGRGIDPVDKVWQNGTAGAGHTRQTPESDAGGGYSHGQNVTSQSPGYVMPAGQIAEVPISSLGLTASFYDTIMFGTDLWITCGRYGVKIPGNGLGTPVVGKDFGSSFTAQSVIVFDGKLLVSGAGTGSIWSYDGATWSQGTSVERSRFEKVRWRIGDEIATGGAAGGGGLDALRLIGTNASGTAFYHLASGANPLVAGNWSSAATITDGGQYTIQKIVANNHTVWFSTTGGVFACNSLGDAANLTTWVEKYYNSSNGGACAYQDGVILYGHQLGVALVGTSGDRQDVPAWAQFGYKKANGTPVYGRPHQIEPAGSCVYVAYSDTGTTYIMAVTINPDGSLTWSGPEGEIGNESCSMLRAVSLGSGTTARPYLLIGTNASGSPKLYLQSLPVTGSPYADYINRTNHTYATSWGVTLPRYTLNESAPKEVQQYECVVENGQYQVKDATINVSTGGQSYTEVGTAWEDRTVFVTSTDVASGTGIQIRVECSNPVNDPLILETVAVRMQVQPEPIETDDYVVQIVDGQAGKMGQMNEDPDFIYRSLLNKWRRGIISFTDQYGRTSRRRVLPTVSGEEIEGSKAKPWTIIASFSTRLISEDGLVNVGDVIDSGTMIASA
jgi:hypothetical protein